MLPIGEQPMREEAARAFSTFLRSGGSRALGVSDDLRQFARTCLAKSSAPECVSLPTCYLSWDRAEYSVSANIRGSIPYS
jgi:hypothetical protein